MTERKNNSFVDRCCGFHDAGGDVRMSCRTLANGQHLLRKDGEAGGRCPDCGKAFAAMAHVTARDVWQAHSSMTGHRGPTDPQPVTEPRIVAETHNHGSGVAPKRRGSWCGVPGCPCGGRPNVRPARGKRA